MKAAILILYIVFSKAFHVYDIGGSSLKIQDVGENWRYYLAPGIHPSASTVQASINQSMKILYLCYHNGRSYKMIIEMLFVTNLSYFVYIHFIYLFLRRIQTFFLLQFFVSFILFGWRKGDNPVFWTLSTNTPPHPAYFYFFYETNEG